ncbi:MAG: hypothetical protein J7647_05580 [Cyanobacteria bacterium SBLK]|nr:hypothetical protein [Cyanobacteria bacterium SBLK]
MELLFYIIPCVVSAIWLSYLGEEGSSQIGLLFLWFFVMIIVTVPLALFSSVGAISESLANIIFALICASPFLFPILTCLAKYFPENSSLSPSRRSVKGSPVYNLRFEVNIRTQFNSKYGEEWGSHYIGNVVAYYTSGINRGKKYRSMDVQCIGHGYSESAAVADAQYKFNHEIEQAKQKLMNL